jgi:tripartite-type tricarboxylate transporter receptor subunit TctC
VGSAPQILGAALMKTANVRFVEIPYKGVQAPLTDMLAGRVDLMFASESAATPYIRDGRLKAIATSDTQRSRALPELPTLMESGTNLSLEAWLGLFAPANVPPDVLAALKTQVRASLPAMQPRLAAGANETMDLSPEATDAYLRQQYEYWTKLIGSIGITLD